MTVLRFCPPRPACLLAMAVAPLVVLAGVAAPAARADDYLDRLNAIYASIPKDKRSDLVLLPLAAKMTDPPAEVRTEVRAALLPPSSKAWPAVAEWAQAAPQAAVLKAIVDITSEPDYLKAMVFAQGYGVDAVADQPALIEANLFTDVGAPPILAAAKFNYLPALDRVQILVQVETTRLADAANHEQALELLSHWLFFARQMADREFTREKAWGMNAMRTALERMRDVAYSDSVAATHILAHLKLRDRIKQLADPKGLLGIERIRLPQGDTTAAEQMLSMILIEKDGTNEDLFAPTLAKITSGDRPLRLFSEAAFWEKARKGHAGWFEARDMLNDLTNDWRKRWSLDPFDIVVRGPSDYAKRVDKDRHYVSLKRVLAAVEGLFPLRLALRTEAAGTRTALAMYAFVLQNTQLPRDLTAIRPFYVDPVDPDPYSSSKSILQYYVPVRDYPPQGPRGQQVLAEIRVWPGEPFPNFSINLGRPRADRGETDWEKNFVLYSVGPDDSKDFAKNATQDHADLEGDYLLWPPVTSLLRRYLVENGKLP